MIISAKAVRALSALLVAAALALPASGQDLRLRGLGNEQLSEADLAQGTTILVVWASWSPRSRDVAPRVNSLAQRWGGRARVATVNFQEQRQQVEGFVSGKGLSVPVFLDPDGAFSKKYGVVNLPGLLVFKDGQVVYRGKLPDDPDRLMAELF